METNYFLLIRQDNSVCLYRSKDGVQWVLFDSLDEADNAKLAAYLEGDRAGVDYEVLIDSDDGGK